MKFSIRDLLLVTVIVALAVGWFVENYRTRSALQEAEERIRQVEEELDNYGLRIYWGGQGVGPLLFRPDGPLYSIPGGNTNQRSLPDPSAPASNPPKK